MGAPEACRVALSALRRPSWMAAPLLGAVLAAGAARGSDEVASDPLLPASRAAVGELAGALKSDLQSTMAEVGLVGAVSVCRDRAARIAAEVSTATGARVARTSMKLRNPDNAPTAAELAGLSDLGRRAAAGADVAGLEYTAYVSREDGVGFLYMKAIPANAVCLVCHGETIAPEVADIINRQYPEDQARGYRLGELRGAFVVEWPAGGQ